MLKASSHYDPILEVDLSELGFDEIPTPTPPSHAPLPDASRDVSLRLKLGSVRSLQQSQSQSSNGSEPGALAATGSRHGSVVLVINSTRDVADNLEALLEDFTLEAKAAEKADADAEEKKQQRRVRLSAGADNDWARTDSVADNSRARVNIGRLRHAFSDRDFLLVASD